MTKQEIIDICEKRFVKPLNYILLLSFFGIPIGGIVGIWSGWSLSWRIMLTSFIVLVLSYILLYILRVAIKQVAEEHGKTIKNTKSAFQQKMEYMMEEQKNKA